MIIKKIKKELKLVSSKGKANILQRFFKTGKGEYGEGDVFLGVTVPNQRKIVSKYYKEISLNETETLLQQKIHEYRLTALLLLVKKYEIGNKENDIRTKEDIYHLYLKNMKYVNNWDLVDLTAPNIVGNFLLDKNRKKLYELAESDGLWERRISILATFEFIKNGEYKDTFAISKLLLDDEHDLIHKGVGWMLREVGKKISEEVEERFLMKHYKQMPRTMLRYAIERFSQGKKSFYMKK